MIKQILTYSITIVMMYTGYSQIGIGTSSPDPSSVLDISSTESGLLIPRMTTLERDGISSPVNGLMIYNTDKGCIELNYGTGTDINWNCIGTVNSSAVVKDCTINGFEGSYINGIGLTASNTFSVTITNNSFNTANISFATSDLTLAGVSGLTVSSVNPPSVVLPSGASQLVEYTLTGTPSSTGTLIGLWSKLGLNCIQNIDVINGDATFILPTSIEVASISDGVPLVDLQGIIDNSGHQITLDIPYTSGVGSYDAFTGNYTLNNLGTGEGGDVNSFRLSYPAGTFNTTGAITVTIEVNGDGNFNAKKQLFGIHDVIATLDFQVNGVNKGNINLDVVGGVLDKNFSDSNHKFVYLPIVAEDGRVWLNNNLGSNYSKIGHSEFSPSKQATSYNDYNAYGSAFQWGRPADGHELINYTDSTVGTPLNGTTISNATSSNPGHDLFIIGSNDWITPKDDNLWQGESGINNPCPQGYRLPTEPEVVNLYTEATISDHQSGANSSLALTSPGYRDVVNGNLTFIGVIGYYWTSSVLPLNAHTYTLSQSGGTSSHNNFRGYGFRVRCIKD